MCRLTAVEWWRLTKQEKDGSWCRRADMSRLGVGRIAMGRRYTRFYLLVFIAKESQVQKLGDLMALIDR